MFEFGLTWSAEPLTDPTVALTAESADNLRLIDQGRLRRRPREAQRLLEVALDREHEQPP